MAAIPSYRAEMTGLSERDRTLLRSLLAASQARTGIRWDGGAAEPAVHFIDVDTPAGADFWQSLPESDRRYAAIVIGVTQPPGGVLWLSKPLRSASLLVVLERMKQPPRVPPAPAPVVAATAAKPAPKVARILDPNEPLRLLDVLDDTGSTTARAVQSARWPDLVLGAGNRHAMRTAPLERYVEGFAESIDVVRVTKYTGGPLSDDQRVDLDTLRWLAVLHAPLAEIARRLPHPARARLRTLPPFGHLPHTLAHVRMAAWLTQHSASPQELAEMSASDDEEVLRFLGACEAIGLLQEAVDAPAPPVMVPAAVAAVSPAPTETVSAPEAPVQIAVTPPAPAAAFDAAIAESEADISETPVAESAGPAPVETAGAQSVFERLRAAREQNRARVAAAIRHVRGGDAAAQPPSAPQSSAAPKTEIPPVPAPESIVAHTMA